MRVRARRELTRPVPTWRLIPLLALICASGLAGQDSRRPDGGPEVGDTVRFVRAHTPVRGTIVRKDGGIWEVEVDALDGPAVTVGPDSLRDLQVFAGRGRNILGGMGLGLLVGGATGAVIGLASASDDSIVSENAQVGLSSLFMGGIGLVVGGIVGAIPRDRWEEVSPPPSGVRLTAVPVADGAILTATLRF